jgi:hypothetical protein
MASRTSVWQFAVLVGGLDLVRAVESETKRTLSVLAKDRLDSRSVMDGLPGRSEGRG